MSRDVGRFTRKRETADLNNVRSLAVQDPRWFIENYLKIAAKSRSDVYLKFNHSQQQVWEDVAEAQRENKPVRLVILKSRQVGISTQLSGYVFADAWCRDNTNALIVAHLKDVTTNLFKKQKKFYHCLPPEFQIPLERSSKQEIAFETINSSIILSTAGTPHAARSQTLHDVLASEAAFYGDNLSEFRTAMEASVPNEAGTFIAYESTAFGSGTEFHQMYKVAKSNDRMDETSSIYKARFLEWFTDPLCSLPAFPSDYIRDKYMEGVYAKAAFLKSRGEHYGLSPEQIAWYFMTCQNNYSLDWVKMQQEFPCDEDEAFLSTGQTVVPVELIQRFKNWCKDGKLYDTAKNFTGWESLTEYEAPWLKRDEDTYFEVWVPPQQHRHYLAMMDTASGIESSDRKMKGDASCMMFFDIVTGNMVAQLHGRMEPKYFAKLGIRLARIYNEALIVPETDGLGVATLHEVKENYSNIYQQRKHDGYATRITTKLGWDMTPSLRLEIFSVLRRIMQQRSTEENCPMIPCARTISEMSTFTYGSTNNMKPKAEKGCYDDRMICLAVGAYTCMEELRDRPHLSTIQMHTMKDNRNENDEPRLDDILRLVKHRDFTGMESLEDLRGMSYGDTGPFYQSEDGADDDEVTFG